MNAGSFEQMRAQAAARDPRDDKMEQVRQLLVGDMDSRVSALEQRLQDLDVLVARRLETISQRIDTLASQLDFDRRAAFAELSQGVLDLSERIRSVSKGNAI
jgi:archaellum component FlaC